MTSGWSGFLPADRANATLPRQQPVTIVAGNSISLQNFEIAPSLAPPRDLILVNVAVDFLKLSVAVFGILRIPLPHQDRAAGIHSCSLPQVLDEVASATGIRRRTCRYRGAFGRAVHRDSGARPLIGP